MVIIYQDLDTYHTERSTMTSRFYNGHYLPGLRYIPHLEIYND